MNCEAIKLSGAMRDEGVYQGEIDVRVLWGNDNAKRCAALSCER